MIQGIPPPAGKPAADSSARVTTEPTAAELRAPAERQLAEELTRLGAVKVEELGLPDVGFPASRKEAPKPSELITSTTRGTGTEPDTAERPKPDQRKALDAASGTGTRRVGQPGQKRVEKPPTIAGYSWRDDGAGWQLRRSVVVDGKRRRPYVAHLSKSAYRDLKRGHKGKALAEALAQWVADREREKGKGNLANFAGLIVGKLEERKAKEQSDVTKLDELIKRVSAFR